MIPRRFWSGLTFWVALCILFSLYFLWTHVSDPSSVVAPVGQNNPPPPVKAPVKAPEKEPERAPERAPAKAPVKTPEKVLEKEPEKEPEKAPEKAPEKEPDKEPEVKDGINKDGKVVGVKTYKDFSKEKTYPPIEDNFPWGNSMQSRKDFPKIPSWNRPPATHVKEKTPLFIGFTRTWPMLQQVVLSYITAGWPPEDIYVVENTGTLHSNKNGLLSLQNPFFLNHTRLDLFGVNILITPTLLTFSQLQTYYLFTALENGWDYFFWSHMDVIITTDENAKGSFYSRVVDHLRETLSKKWLGDQKDWAIRFYAYDWLALNHVQAFIDIGGWDTFISYYTADCDMHERFKMANITLTDVEAGNVSDVGESINTSLLFRKKIDPNFPPKTAAELDALDEDERAGNGYDRLLTEILAAVEEKKSPEHERNWWQGQQTGGKGDPFYREPHGFAENLERVVQCGIQSYQSKWGGHKGCGLEGFNTEDAWMIENTTIPVT